jgi:flagellar hook-associated protein 2
VLKGGTLLANPGAEARIPWKPPVELGANMVLEFKYRTYRIPEEPVPEVKPPPGPTLSAAGSVEYQGIRIENEPSRALLPDWKPPKASEKITDMEVFFLDDGTQALPLPEIRDSEEFQKVQVEVGKRAAVMAALGVRNRNTHRQVEVRDIFLYDRTQRGDYKPLKPLAEAADAVLSMDGIEVTRPRNTVDDLIPGVKLNLLKAGDAPVDLEVGRDTESIKKQIIALTGSYNRIAADIDILTRKDEQIIDDLSYLSEEEKAAARKRLGLLFGDLTLQQLKSGLQQTLSGTYPTSKGRDLSMLAQVGISTDTRKPGSVSIDRARLRGYLEIDEAKLDEAIRTLPDAVKELFGSDTDGDLVVNAGVAYSLDTLLKPYVATGGLLTTRMGTLDSSIARQKKEIADYTKEMDSYQSDLKRKYAVMEGQLNALEKNSQSIGNFSKQNSQ